MCHDGQAQPPVTPTFQDSCDAINECRRSAQWQSAAAWLTWQGHQRLRPNIVVHGAATSACDRATQWRQAVQQLAIVGKVQLRVDVVLHNNLMNTQHKGLGHPGAKTAEGDEKHAVR